MRNLRRALSLALASIMLMGMMVIGSSARDFVDADKITNKEAVSVLSALDIMVGDGDSFAPTRVVTRAEMAALLCRAVKVNESLIDSLADTRAFSDVETGQWYTGSIAIAAQKGWIVGDGILNEDGFAKFHPANTVTTAEAVLMIQKALGYWNENDAAAAGNLLARANTLAYELDMMEQLTLSANAGLTRDNVAGVFYNAITKTVPVIYSADKGYLLANDTTKLATSNNIQDALGDDFANSLFAAFGVTKVAGADYADALGRPVTAWEKDGAVITFTTANPDFVYSEKTSAEDIAKAMKVDYDENETFFDDISTALDTANSVVELFGTDETATVVSYTFRTASVADVDTDKDGTTTVTLDNSAKSTFVTTAAVTLDEGDIVVFTDIATDKQNPATGDSYDGDIATIALADTVAGKVTAKATAYIRLDGVKYTVANADATEIGTAGVVVLDPNGNAMTFLADDGSSAVTTYAYVTAIRTETSAATGKHVGYADLVLADGAQVTVSLDMDEDNTLHVAGTPNKAYTYSVSGNLYTLSAAHTTAATSLTLETGKRALVDGVTAGFDTIFVDVANGVAYTGIEELVGYTEAAISYVATEGVADIVFITAGKLVDLKDASFVYVATTAYESSRDADGTTVYTYTDVYADGVAMKLVSTKNNLFADTGLFTIDTLNADGYATSATAHTFGANEQDITVDSVTAKAIYAATGDRHFTYDADTTFVRVDGEEVSAATASSIIIDKDVKVGNDTCTISVVLDGDSNYAELVIITIAEKA